MAWALVVTAAAAVRPAADADFGLHVQLGAEIGRTGSLPRVDHLSFTARAPYVDHKWLAHLTLYMFENV